MDGLIGFFALCFTTLFAIVNPLSTAIVYEGLASSFKKKQKLEIVNRAILSAFIIMVIFAVSGMLILNFFNITIDALRIGGGLYLVILALRMLNPEKSQKILHPNSKIRKSDDIALVPLAIPLLSGPGTIAAIVVLLSHDPGFINMLTLIAAITVVMIISYFILRLAHDIQRVLRNKGIKTLEKIMGLIILGIGVQFILNGLKDYILGIFI